MYQRFLFGFSTRFTFCLFLVLFWMREKKGNGSEENKISDTQKEDECLKKSRSHYDPIPYILHKNKLTGILMGTSENLCTVFSLSLSPACFAATRWLSSKSVWSRMDVQYVVQSVRKSNAKCIPISFNLRLHVDYLYQVKRNTSDDETVKLAKM